jgi:hypothetical protein
MVNRVVFKPLPVTVYTRTIRPVLMTIVLSCRLHAAVPSRTSFPVSAARTDKEKAIGKRNIFVSIGKRIPVAQ